MSMVEINRENHPLNLIWRFK